MRTYQASATEQGSQWIIHVPEISTVTEATSEIDIIPAAKKHISQLLRVPATEGAVAGNRLTYQPQHC